MIDIALAMTGTYERGAMPDMSEIEMAIAIGQLTATINLLAAALGRHPASTA